VPQGDLAMSGARAYEVDGSSVDSAAFIAVACDPARSVVVEACAGSGKTWLLVSRLLRLLLSGADPSELLAITFTRKAAQEMRERLLQLLHELALAPDDRLQVLLAERGIDFHRLQPAESTALLRTARGLYGNVLSSPHGLSIDTFHSWFGQLLRIAPLASGVPHGYALTESTSDLRKEAYRRFMQELNDPAQVETRLALLRLYDMSGDWNARKLLEAFIEKRAEWWAARQSGQALPLQRLRELCAEDGESDARLRLWQDRSLCERIMSIARLLGAGTAANQKRAAAIEAALNCGADAETDSFHALCDEFFDGNGKCRRNRLTASLSTALERQFGTGHAASFEEEFNAVAEELQRLLRRGAEQKVLALNEALFQVGDAMLETYQSVKAEQRVFDFSDLEWHAYRLLTSHEHAAYLQSRLDARYKHILLDEFQDTNPLQWSIVRAWLSAYGDDVQKPSVFIVGDPKQSIYRFRRAEPRVFAAARSLLQSEGAAVLRTNQTRRNASGIVSVLNASFAGNPLFASQTTLAAPGGEVWRLPLVQPVQSLQSLHSVHETDTETAAFSLRNPLTTPRLEEEDARRLDEGRAIARAILQLCRHPVDRHGRDQGQADAQPRAWSDVLLLVKKRAYLTAYQAALREAGIPFVSDNRGGLLQALEVSDLVALLNFLVMPGDDRALAQVLKSPLFGASDDDLILLASHKAEHYWWTRLQRFQHPQHLPAPGCSAVLKRAQSLLSCWLEMAPRLPVHDLLDKILHTGDVIARYASMTRPELRSQVIGNIEAFVELALNLDAGRYPSLPKFINEVQSLRNEAESDAPDEAAANAGVDAVRILTIHGAKGLEAPIVVLADANHSKPARDDCGILCDWPEDADAPTHFSGFGRKDERGVARDALFEAEEAFRQQEDWNLLYVAATRAREMLFVSGVCGTQGALEDGCIEGSWYHRLLAVPEMGLEEQQSESDLRKGNGNDNNNGMPAEGDSVRSASFSLAMFDPPSLPANRR
jgi:ATP-dependent helicase/nuclease subunit A